MNGTGKSFKRTAVWTLVTLLAWSNGVSPAAGQAGTPLTWLGSGGGDDDGQWDTVTNDWLTADGIRSTIWANSASASFGGTAGTVTMGADGIATSGMTFKTGGYVVNGAGHLLTLQGSSSANTVSIAANNTTINAAIAGSAVVSTTGALTLGNGGTMAQLNVTQDAFNLSGGTLTLSDPNNPLTVGNGSLFAQMTISDGAQVSSLGQVTLVDGDHEANGSNPAPNTSLTVTGAGSSLSTGNLLKIGSSATGELDVLRGGSVTTAGSADLRASSAAAVSVALVSGAGSQWITNSLRFDGFGGGTATLTVSHGGAATVAGNTSFPSTSGSSLTVNAGTFTTGGLSGAGGAIQLVADPTGGAALNITGTGFSQTYSGTMTGAGSILMTGGSQTLSFDGSGFTGATTINGGVLTLGTGVELENSAVTIGTANGLNLNGNSLVTLGSLAGSGALNLGSTALSVGGNNGTTAYSGTFSASSGSDFTKQGTGTLTLSGGGFLDRLDASSGGVAITGGTLQLGSGIQVGINTASSQTTISGGAQVTGDGFVTVGGLAGTSLTIDGAGTLLSGASQTSVDGGTLTVQNGAQMTSTASNSTIVGVSGSGALNVMSGGQVTSGDSALGVYAGSTGAALVSGVGSNWTANSLGLGGIEGPGGTGNLTITGGGNVTVSAATRFFTSSSTITINGGSMTTGGLVSVAGIGGTINLQAHPSGGPALTINGFGGSYAGTITGTGDLLASTVSMPNMKHMGTQSLTGDNTNTGTMTVSAGILIQQGGSNDSQIHATTGTFIANGTTLRPLLGFGSLTADQDNGITYGPGTTVIGGFLSGTGVQLGSGGSFIGTTLNAGSGLSTTASTQFTNVVDNGAVTTNGGSVTWTGGSIGSSGQLTVNGDDTVTASQILSNGAITLNGGATLSYSGGNFTLGGGSRTYIGSVVSPGGNLNVTGGNLELNGGLLVNNGTVNGTLDVNFGGEAEGAGTYGIVNVNQGGVFHPGNSPGTVTTEGASWNAGGALEFDLASATGNPGTDWSLWNMLGMLTMGAGTTTSSVFTIQIDSATQGGLAGLAANFDPTQNYSWVLATTAGINGFSSDEFALNATSFENALNGGIFSLVEAGNNLVLDFTAAPTPEPGTLALLLAAAAALAMRARRKRV